MTKHSSKLKSVRPDLAGDLDRLARTESAAILEKFEQDSDPVDQGVLDIAADRTRRRCIDALLSEPITDKVCGSVEIVAPDLQILAFDVRQSAPVLRIEPPEPTSQIRLGFFIVMASMGALMGMMFGTWLCVLMRIQPAGYEAGRAMGALLGPASAVALGYYVVQDDRLRRIIQWVLGIAALGIGVSELLAWINPAGQLWRLMRTRMSGTGRWGKLKLFLLCLALIALLQLGKPVRKTSRRQLRSTVNQAIRSWLDGCLDLMTLLLLQQKHPTMLPAASGASAITAQPLLEVLGKLSVASSAGERSDIAEELLQECENLGMTFASNNGHGAFEESLLDTYDVIGLINPGDAYRELESPIRDGDRVVVKGRITRERRPR